MNSIYRLLHILEKKIRGAWNRKLGRLVSRLGGFDFDVVQLERSIEERTCENVEGSWLAPHVFEITFDYKTHAFSTTKAIEEFESEVRGLVVDYINDRRHYTLAPVKVFTVVDPFAQSITVNASYGEFEHEVRRLKGGKPDADINTRLLTRGPSPAKVIATVMIDKTTRVIPLDFTLEKARLYVGRADDCDLRINAPSVAPLHSVLMFKNLELVLADLESGNGTSISGRYLSRGETRTIKLPTELVLFGNVRVRFRLAPPQPGNLAYDTKTM